MKDYRLIVFMAMALTLTACSESEQTDAEPEGSNGDTEEELDNGEKSEDEGTEGEDISNNEDENATEEDAANEEEDNAAVAPSDPNDTNLVDFQRINWIMGSPDREPEPGIWLYTEDDYPEGDEDTFDLDEYDVLHYQTDDYMGYTLRAQQIVIEDDDTARISVDIHSEPNDSDDEEDYEMPRQHLNVEQGALRDKNFIVEMEDGETLNLE